MTEENEIEAAVREIRAFLEANNPETLAFLARVGNQTEIITAGEGDQGKFEQIDLIVYYLKKLADREGLDLEKPDEIDTDDLQEE